MMSRYLCYQITMLLCSFEKISVMFIGTHRFEIFDRFPSHFSRLRTILLFSEFLRLFGVSTAMILRAFTISFYMFVLPMVVCGVWELRRKGVPFIIGKHGWALLPCLQMSLCLLTRTLIRTNGLSIRAKSGSTSFFFYLLVQLLQDIWRLQNPNFTLQDNSGYTLIFICLFVRKKK